MLYLLQSHIQAEMIPMVRIYQAVAWLTGFKKYVKKEYIRLTLLEKSSCLLFMVQNLGAMFPNQIQIWALAVVELGHYQSN